MTRFHISLLILLGILASSTSLIAQVPRTISFQGVLTDGTGEAISDGQHELLIRLYDSQQGGQVVFTETHFTEVTDGLFNILIGSVSLIPSFLEFDQAYFLGIAVDNDPELVPRTALTAVPYALYAPIAGQAGSLAPNAGGVVTSMNTIQGDVTLRGGGSTTVSQNGNDITISSVGGGGSGIQGVQNIDATLSIQNPNGPVATIGVADNAIGTSKLKDASVSSQKLTDASVTSTKIQSGAVHLDKINTAGAANGQVPAFDGANIKWTTPQSGGGGLTLPFDGSSAAANHAFKIQNTGAGSAVEGRSESGTGVYGLSQRGNAASFKTETANTLDAVLIQSNGSGDGIHVNAARKGVYARSTNGIAGHFVTAATQAHAVLATNLGTGAGISASSIGGVAIAASTEGPEVAIKGVSSGTVAAILAQNNKNGGIGIKAEADGGRALFATSITSTAVLATSSSGLAVSAASTSNVALRAQSGSGNIIEAYGDGGLFGNLRFRVLQNGNVRCDGAFTGGGADVAEAFEFEGVKTEYESGDVLVVSHLNDNKIMKCSSPISKAVVGVYATKPGVLLSQHGAEDDISHLIPMGVLGIIPTKVCAENGPIQRGDLLVTSSLPGHAMKSIPAIINGIEIYPTGAIIGKALESFDGQNEGKINVMVNVK
jgi:hypothetical protein